MQGSTQPVHPKLGRLLSGKQYAVPESVADLSPEVLVQRPAFRDQPSEARSVSVRQRPAEQVCDHQPRAIGERLALRSPGFCSIRQLGQTDRESTHQYSANERIEPALSPSRAAQAQNWYYLFVRNEGNPFSPFPAIPIMKNDVYPYFPTSRALTPDGVGSNDQTLQVSAGYPLSTMNAQQEFVHSVLGVGNQTTMSGRGWLPKMMVSYTTICAPGPRRYVAPNSFASPPQNLSRFDA